MSENRIELKPITIADAGRARYATNAITLDKYGRLSLRAAARDKLAITGDTAYVYISVDPRTKTIGIVRQDVATRLPDAKAMRVDGRGYVSGRAIIDKLALKPGELYTFEYVGQHDAEGERWHAWRLAED